MTSHHTLLTPALLEHGPEYDIANWPVHNDLQEGLDKIKESHVVVPILAYDVDRRLIHPTEYRSKLKGATVEVRFILQHWAINEKKSVGKGGTDSYTADVQSIQVLVPPIRVTSPRKRVVLYIGDDINSSPTKRPKLSTLDMNILIYYLSYLTCLTDVLRYKVHEHEIEMRNMASSAFITSKSKH